MISSCINGCRQVDKFQELFILPFVPIIKENLSKTNSEAVICYSLDTIDIIATITRKLTNANKKAYVDALKPILSLLTKMKQTTPKSDAIYNPMQNLLNTLRRIV